VFAESLLICGESFYPNVVTFVHIFSYRTVALLTLQKAEMEARLKRKAELQKKASKPQTFTESLIGEMSKQKDMEKSKQERRDAMCEELGRGC
jgi:hypothetical protein